DGDVLVLGEVLAAGARGVLGQGFAGDAQGRPEHGLGGLGHRPSWRVARGPLVRGFHPWLEYPYHVRDSTKQGRPRTRWRAPGGAGQVATSEWSAWVPPGVGGDDTCPHFTDHLAVGGARPTHWPRPQKTEAGGKGRRLPGVSRFDRIGGCAERA